MDRNNIIGFLLIFLLLIGYSIYMGQQEPPAPPKQQTQAKPAAQAPAADVASAPVDSAAAQRMYGDFAQAATGDEKDIVLENKDLRLTLSNRGGRVKEVLLKGYKTYDQKPLVLVDDQSSSRSLRLPTRNGEVNLYDLYFATNDAGGSVQRDGDSLRVAFRLALGQDRYVEQTYTLRGAGFQVGYDLKVNGLENVLGNAPAQLYWRQRLKNFEKDANMSQLAASLNYYTAAEEFIDVGENSIGDDGAI